MARTGTQGGGQHHRMIEAAMALIDRPLVALPTLEDIALKAEVDLADARRIFADHRRVYQAAAEQGMAWLNDACVRSVVKVDPEDAVGQFMALGDAYLEWAVDHEPYFRLISDGYVVRLAASPELHRHQIALRDLMRKFLERAKASGVLAQNTDIELMAISARCFSYGLARMVIDGRIEDWNSDTPPLDTAKAAMHDFIGRIARGSHPGQPF